VDREVSRGGGGERQEKFGEPGGQGVEKAMEKRKRRYMKADNTEIGLLLGGSFPNTTGEVEIDTVVFESFEEVEDVE
jgi:hypothetical protein